MMIVPEATNTAFGASLHLEEVDALCALNFLPGLPARRMSSPRWRRTERRRAGPRTGCSAYRTLKTQFDVDGLEQEQHKWDQTSNNSTTLTIRLQANIWSIWSITA